MPPNAAIGRILIAAALGTALLGVWRQAAVGQNLADVENVFPLAPRELRQRLTRAQAAVAEERFSDAVAEIGEILNTAGSDDFFLGIPGSPDAQLSLKTDALALLGSMPLKGRRMYELQYGSDAKAALESALADGDLVKLTEVSRRYFQTKAGYEATLLLGRLQLDQGRPLAAALTLKRVADVPTALAQYDPELSVLLATCWIHANQPAAAEETLLELKQRLPQARIRLVDREVGLFPRDSAALDWLRDIVGGARSAYSSALAQWAVYRGDEKRNARSGGGVPLLNFNWKLPTVNDPTDEGRVTQQLRAMRDRDEPLICSLQPLVVHDYAIVRQPESNKLVGISLTKNGKREWVYPPFEENTTSQAARQATQANRGPLANARTDELKQRIWEDHAFGQVSSDGRQVYLIDDLSLAPLPGVNIAPVGIGPRGMRFQNPAATKSHNLLVALDLAKQGYQVWHIGGTTGDNPALAGAFFLGPPLPVGDQLYALAEFSGEIRLLCIDSRTGALDWKQQLAVLEASQITWDKSRRLAGASPSLADGILVCPTSAGAVVAIDLATRTLRWGYQYRRNDFTPQFAGGRGFRNVMTPPVPVPGGSWLDATATLADGCVVLTPPESQQLHCLDLLTGKARWSPIPRDDMLLVACVYQGKIILLGKNRLKAINLADGKPAWTSEIKLEGETTVGRGYYSDRFYFLPVSGQQLCKIDLDAGAIVSRAQTETELGNLVCYKDQLISLSPQAVASFVLLSEQLEKQLIERLAANPEDLEALALKAQILLQEGKAEESLTLLRRAAVLAPERPTIRNLLVKVMLALVRQDFTTHLPLTDELEKLVTDPAQRREVLRWRVQGLVQSDRKWDAFQAILELADQELAAAVAGTVAAPLQAVERERSVRPDRWLQGQLQRLVASSDSITKDRIVAELKLRLERVVSAGNVSQLRMFLNLFGFSELAGAARLALVEKLVAADALLEAEFVAGDLLAGSDRAAAALTVALLANLYEKAKRPELAARMYERLGAEFAGLVARDGSSGHELAQRARANEALAPHFASWPIGQVEVKENESSTNWQQRSAFPLQLTHYYGAAQRGLRANYDTQRSEITIRGDSGQLLGTASLRGSDGNPRRPGYSVPNNSLTGKTNGHLFVMNLGAEIAAVDGLRADRTADALLWRQDATDDPTGTSAQRGVFSSSRTTNPLLGIRTNTYDSTGRQAFGTGPLTASGVVFQRGRQLVCVDPLTGQSLWERSSTPQAEIPQQAELFGDGELLFVADARLESKATDALVLSAIDGSILGRRKLDLPERRWVTSGRNVLAWDEKNSLVMLKLYDAWDHGRELWSRQLAKASRGHIIDGEELAILEPSGQFTVVSLATGNVRYAVPLEAEPALAWIQVIRSESQYLLLASQEVAGGNGGLMPLPISNGMPQRGMHGRAYAFRRATGKLQWPTPAFVAQHWLPPDQPTESPLLFFVAMRQNNNKTSTVILALDRRTGQIVYENELAGAMAVTCDVVADLPKRTVTLALVGGQGNRGVTFQFTDNPRPPQPPAQTGEMASTAAGRLPGVVDQTLGAAIQLLQGSFEQRGVLPPNFRAAPRP
jgi:outer membrane protein assembly factor BamB